MEALLATLAAPVTALFQYNRGNFMYDKGQDLTKKYQSYTFKVNQFGLYREDIRDLVALTTDMTNNYQLIATLELGFVVALIGPARLPAGTESWLVWLTFAGLANSALYLLISIWFASHASISATSYATRLLTQHVRLPVPSDTQLSEAVTRAQDFEGNNVKKMLRLPFLKATFKRVWDKSENGNQDIISAQEHEQLMIPLLTHIRLYRKLQQYWLNFDGYARISLAMGTYCLIHTLAFYSIGYYAHTMRNFYAALAGVFVFSILGVLLMSLDLIMTRTEVVQGAVLFVAGPLLAFVASSIQYAHAEEVWYSEKVHAWELIIPFILASFVMFVLYILRKATPEYSDDDCLSPSNFRVVQFLDVFKNFRSDQTSRAIDVMNQDADRDDLDPALAKVQAEGALSGAIDEWKGKKNLTRVWTLLDIALQLAEAADLPDDHPLVIRAKRHIEELDIIKEIQKIRRTLQMLQMPSLTDALPPFMVKDIDNLYQKLPNFSDITTTIQDFPELNSDEVWLHVDMGNSDSYFISLGDEHKKEKHVSQNALIIVLAQLKQEIDKYKGRMRDIKAENKVVAPLYKQLDAPRRPGEKNKKRMTTWFKKEGDADYDDDDNDPDSIEGQDISAPIKDRYSMNNILQGMGAAFMPKNPSRGGVDDARFVASMFPWKSFRRASLSIIAVWSIVCVVRIIAIPYRKILFWEYIARMDKNTGGARRVLMRDHSSPAWTIDRPFFQPTAISCGRGLTILGNSYVSYSADGTLECTKQHLDIVHLNDEMYALGKDGLTLHACNHEVSPIPKIELSMPLRRLSMQGDYGVGIPKDNEGMVLIRWDKERQEIIPLASLSNKPTSAVAIERGDRILAIQNDEIVSWPLHRNQNTGLEAGSSRHFKLSDNMEYLGLCSDGRGLSLLEKSKPEASECINCIENTGDVMVRRLLWRDLDEDT